MTRIRPMQTEDCVVLNGLLQAEGLPTELLTAPCFWLVAQEGEEVVGCVALDRGMVRSLVVAQEHRGQGVGGKLIAALLEEAASQGLAELYLLTEHAAGFFRRAGFFVIDRMQVPESMRRQPVFSSICPACSVAMAREVPKGESHDQSG